ncbi:bifunctional DNA primase/polymerase [Roseovarius sp. SCSIO 43702]|uniref:phage/plasmid primase, P4 family n=1 Tax=Roseovarius sp. SCSIO 43702 TaxID=2823043 RepID=UPI001C72BE27|nr:phage/plasmid primase, P4 family [Roseovarius sp. SCSIO 43702]QYX55508.1 bifunctional DNA primase/polymerase [Roseovarius sp. SCSIO 43702]
MNMQDSFPTIADAALEYAARGWHVFPAPPGKKQSYEGAKDHDGRRWGATNDPDLVAALFAKHPHANIGIATQESGLVVLDLDRKNNVDGIGWLLEKIKAHGDLPHTIEATSPSGGWHVYFRYPGDFDPKTCEGEIAPGVDVRGHGGMVLAAPSIKPGSDNPYRWKNPPGLFEVATAPQWILDLLPRRKKLSERAAPAARVQIDTGGASAWADKALQDELAKLLAAPEGKRNGALNSAAFNLAQIVAGGGLAEDTVKARLSAAGAGIGLEPGEIVATIDSGFQAGSQTPRGPKERTTGARAATADGQPRPNTPDELDLSHDALATDLGARSFDRDARHVATWGKWLFWEGTRWQIDDRLEHLTRTRTYLRDRAEDLTGWAERKAAALDDKEADKLRAWGKDQSRWLRNKITVASVESLARSNPASVARADAFDENRLLLGTPGGTVDLRTGHLRTADRRDMITKATACAPAAPGSRPERWLTFLHEIFDDDADLVAFMQRAAGYALTGLTTEHKLLFLYGTGRNGKSVFLNTLTHIWADYARRAAAETFLNSAVEKHSTGLAGLQGARLVAGSELPVGKTWDESTIKDLTGGDRMTARFMRGDFFDFDPQLTLMIAGNNQPSFRGVDEAIRARVVLVPFLVTIPPERRDKSLPDKLMAEGPEILRWAIEGALQWQERGLDVPAKVAAASTEYMDDEDTLGQFLIDETVTDPGGFVTTTDLHDRFKFWCERQGLHAWTLHTLRKELKSRGFQDHRRPHGRGFIGLKTR